MKGYCVANPSCKSYGVQLSAFPLSHNRFTEKTTRFGSACCNNTFKLTNKSQHHIYDPIFIMNGPSNISCDGNASQPGNVNNGTRGSSLPTLPSLSNSLLEMTRARYSNDFSYSVRNPHKASGSSNRSPTSQHQRRLELVSILDEAIRVGDDFLATNGTAGRSLLNVTDRDDGTNETRQ